MPLSTYLSQLLLSTSSRVDSSKSAPSVMVLKMSLTVPLSALLVPSLSFVVPLLLRRLVLIRFPSSSYLYLLLMFSLLVLLTISLEAKYTDADWISLVSGWRSFRPGSKVNPRSVKALPAFDLFRAWLTASSWSSFSCVLCNKNWRFMFCPSTDPKRFWTG
jgi:hypothetical protein